MHEMTFSALTVADIHFLLDNTAFKKFLITMHLRFWPWSCQIVTICEQHRTEFMFSSIVSGRMKLLFTFSEFCSVSNTASLIGM